MQSLRRLSTIATPSDSSHKSHFFRFGLVKLATGALVLNMTEDYRAAHIFVRLPCRSRPAHLKDRVVVFLIEASLFFKAIIVLRLAFDACGPYALYFKARSHLAQRGLGLLPLAQCGTTDKHHHIRSTVGLHGSD